MVRDPFPAFSRKEIQLRIMEVGVAGMTIGLDKFCPGHGFMLDFRVTLVAFDLMFGNMSSVHQLGVVVGCDPVYIGMTTAAPDLGNAPVPDHHGAVTFAALDFPLKYHFMIVCHRGFISLFRNRGDMAFGTLFDGGRYFGAFKMTKKTGALGYGHVTALHDLGMATGTP